MSAVNQTSTVLTMDVGNTSTRFGLFDCAGIGAQAQPLGTWEVTTPARLTADEARMQLAQVLSVLAADAFGAGAGATGAGGALQPVSAVLSCVVPPLTDAWTQALAATCARRPYVVGPGVKTGLSMRYDDPAEVGPDRIADAVAARARYGAPCVVVDLGTTTNIEVIDAQGAFAGGVIAPGLALGARSLSEAAARLPVVDLRAPQHVIGRNTRDAMRSGVVLGEVARIDGMLSMVLAELAGNEAKGGAGPAVEAPIVITGENAAAMAQLLHHKTTADASLTLCGLAELYRVNARPRRA